ncbi:MAG: DoxX family protein [Cyclobacteriaceae bacterium]
MKNKISWVLQITAALIMLQTLYFKFSGAAESIYIFSTIGIEPWGRYFTGFVELVAGVALLTRKWNYIGGILGIGLMAGALFSHLTVLGIEVQGDGGYLFILALVVLTCSSIVALLNIDKIKSLLNSFRQ